ncbi:helix-turn-helix domain-containing protein [Saccharothrix australiensis]|uniref:Helix-turn-helix protein n=1 Tax=Saccharothrix australiensis TaxID=2072 RepID=A0A495VWH6_9PSEU|nr:helix-turn-helix transcriptional regulator [Saccharothrix australiensis]RKT53270.1 helix-turn-helix protein [Saccharothrix australiensis]
MGAGRGAAVAAARQYAGYSLTRLAQATSYSKSYLGLVETGLNPVTHEVVAAYERALGVGVYRPDINHPRLIKIEGPEHLRHIREAVEAGEPDIFAQGPTSSSIDAAVAPVLGEAAIENFRRWAVSGETSTLRANAVSILGFLPGRRNADVVVAVLESDAVVRRLCLASEVSRLTQCGWETALQVADDPTTAPEPRRLAGKLAKEAVDPKDTESRWCAGYLLQRMAAVLGAED